jgi:hypothetical protein
VSLQTDEYAIRAVAAKRRIRRALGTFMVPPGLGDPSTRDCTVTLPLWEMEMMAKLVDGAAAFKEAEGLREERKVRRKTKRGSLLFP